MFNPIRHAAFALAALSAASSASAADQSVTLSYPGMTCSSCPITIKRALMQVDGVKQVKTDLDKKEAVVVFDNSRTNAVKMGVASANAGYPATVKADN